MSSASESEAKKNSRTSGAGPRLKNGGGVCSIPRWGRRPLYPPWFSVVGEDRAEVLHLFERFPRPAHHAGKRIVGDDHRQPGLFHQQAIEPAQQRAAAVEHHPFLAAFAPQLHPAFLTPHLT